MTLRCHLILKQFISFHVNRVHMSTETTVKMIILWETSLIRK